MGIIAWNCVGRKVRVIIVRIKVKYVYNKKLEMLI
jgi:hypothetical protein